MASACWSYMHCRFLHHGLLYHEEGYHEALGFNDSVLLRWACASNSKWVALPNDS